LRHCQELLCIPIESLTIDMGGVEFIDSSGISALIETRRIAQEQGVMLRLRELPDQSFKALSLVGVLDLFDWRAQSY
jgi:anti-sigma B factor antagonist